MLNKIELHVHLLQSLYPEDIYKLAKDCYHEINWNRFAFLDRYEKIFGIRLDPIAIFDRATQSGSLEEIKNVALYHYKPDGNFEEFDITSFFILCITGYYFDKNDPERVLKMIVDRHKKEGIHYIEYRQGFGFSHYEEWKEWNIRFARFLKEQSNDKFQARYIMRVGEFTYPYAIQILKETPDIRDVVVGVDFSGAELSPENLINFYEQVKKDILNDRTTSLDVVVHIGETYFDKSIESAIRWCHQSALLGAKRLAHCIALGLDPVVALTRKVQAHEYEMVEERIKQIKYDLLHQEELRTFGVLINVKQLEKELSELVKKPMDQVIHLPYNQKRIKDLRLRQDYVLSDLKRIGTVIETCPTSNYCIAGIPSIQDHPFIKLYESGVNLVICSDDPGVFNSSLNNEINFVMEKFNIPKDELIRRLGNPYRFRLKKNH